MTGGVVTWTVASLPAGASVDLRVTGSTPAGELAVTLLNHVGISPPAGSPTPTVNQPCSDDPALSCAVTVVPPVLSLTGAPVGWLPAIGTGLIALGVLLLFLGRKQPATS